MEFGVCLEVDFAINGLGVWHPVCTGNLTPARHAGTRAGIENTASTRTR